MTYLPLASTLKMCLPALKNGRFILLKSLLRLNMFTNEKPVTQFLFWYKMKILLIDDEDDLLDICQAIILAEIDIEFITAKSGHDAVKIIEANQEIKIIISDYNMRNGNGAYVFNHIKNKKKIPFCLLTGGYVEDYKDLVDFTPNLDRYHFLLSKPVDEEKLVETVKKMLHLA